MRARLSIAGLALALAGGGSDSDGAPAGFATDQRIVYSDGLHNENTEMIRLHGRILLAFRGGEVGQVGSARARIKVFESRDRGRTFALLSEVNASNLAGDRDIRDPKLLAMDGKLFLYAISRLPSVHYRDLGGQAWTVRAESADGGHTWTPPVRTYQDVDASGRETSWAFWRYTQRPYTQAGKHRRTLFATGYQDGDVAVGLFASDDGITWEKRSTIIASYNDVPSETELQFFGHNHDTAVALVRLDNQDILADGQTAICTSHDPFTTWECGRRIGQRLDGPTWILRRAHGRARSFVFARKHLPCTFKRTAIYELRGDLTDPAAPIEVCEIQELESSGDTAYTSLAPLSRHRSLLAWYSSPVDQELPWFQGISSPSEIWLADVDFGRTPARCVHPPPERGCEPPALPEEPRAFDVSGAHLLTLAPVIWPAKTLSFRADAQVHGTSLELSLQPLDAGTKLPVGAPWTATAAISADGRFTADFGTRQVPAAAYPLLNDPFLTVNEFVLTGVTTSSDGFCGSVAGYAQVFGTAPSDRTRLEGSTFGAARIIGDALPSPVTACPLP
ncbi:MAG: exo-alpha-sialidase [Deltaproteobacteria bacterium]|nr:MAG: exo-alpha-sialidase [Deltaproteobacteria bacterium]